MAICVRRLIEQTEPIVGNRISFVPSNNMSTANTTSLRDQKADLQRVRPDDTLEKIANLYHALTILLRTHSPN